MGPLIGFFPLGFSGMGPAGGRYASNDDSAGHANKWKAKHETGNANSEIVVSVHETIKSKFDFIISQLDLLVSNFEIKKNMHLGEMS